MTVQDSSQPFTRHPGFRRTFAPNALTVGFILPLEAYPNTPAPTMRDHAEVTRLADDLGFAALWARDVPTYDPSFGDTAQVFDPHVYLGFLAANTKNIAIGTAASVIALRHPVNVAKQAASIDALSGGRMLLGVASGDRPSEYPLFGVGADYEVRGDRFQEALAMVRLASEQRFPVGGFKRFGTFSGDLDILPKPVVGSLPTIVVGRSRQELPWLAKHADGWMYYFVDQRKTQLIAEAWRAAVEVQSPGTFKPFAQGLFFDLLDDANAPVQPIHSGMAAGRKALVEYLQRLRASGVNHVALNMKSSRRPVREVLEELAESVLPTFPSRS